MIGLRILVVETVRNFLNLNSFKILRQFWDILDLSLDFIQEIGFFKKQVSGLQAPQT